QTGHSGFSRTNIPPRQGKGPIVARLAGAGRVAALRDGLRRVVGAEGPPSKRRRRDLVPRAGGFRSRAADTLRTQAVIPNAARDLRPSGDRGRDPSLRSG